MYFMASANRIRLYVVNFGKSLLITPMPPFIDKHTLPLISSYDFVKSVIGNPS